MGFLSKLLGKSEQPATSASAHDLPASGGAQPSQPRAAASAPAPPAAASEAPVPSSPLSPETLARMIASLPDLLARMETDESVAEDFWQIFFFLDAWHFIPRGDFRTMIETGGSPRPFCTADERGPAVSIFATQGDALAFAKLRGLGQPDGSFPIISTRLPAVFDYLMSLRDAGVRYAMAAQAGYSPMIELDKLPGMIAYYRPDLYYNDLSPEHRSALVTLGGVRRDQSGISQARAIDAFSRETWYRLAAPESPTSITAPFGRATCVLAFVDKHDAERFLAAMRTTGSKAAIANAAPVAEGPPRWLAPAHAPEMYADARYICFISPNGTSYFPIAELPQIYRELIRQQNARDQAAGTNG